MLISEIVYARCPVCGFDRPHEDYLRPIDVPWSVPTRTVGAKGRRATICYHCRQRNAFEDIYARQWDWAAALNKATAMRVAHASPFDGVWGNVTPHLIRVLDIVQDSQCAVTGLCLIRPDTEELAKARVTLNSWADKLPVQERGRVPALVRISNEAGWDSGNVILIASSAESLYRHCEGLSGFRQTMRTVLDRKSTVPAKDILDETASQVLVRQFETWRKLNNDRVQDEL